MAETFARLGRVEAIRQLFEGSGYAPFGEPLRFEAKAGDTAVSASRVLLEGMDFNLEYFPLKHLGYKAVIAVTGELYAALAHPVSLSVTLGVSAKLDYEQIKELWSGVVTAAKEHGYKSLSLSLQASKNGLCICLAAQGAASQFTLKRCPKPHSKDLIAVSGSLGAAYLGQQVLEHRPKQLENYKMMLAAYLKPELGSQTLAQFEDEEIYPSAACLVSYGLSDALKRISRATGLGAKVYADKIPFEGNSFALGKDLDIDPVSCAMNGGDDFRLLLCIPILKFEKFRRDFQTFDIIGHLALPEAGTVLVTPDGLEHPVSAQGWVGEDD